MTTNASKVWQYAIRDKNINFATCRLCSDNKRISTNNGSTSTLRRHLILKHNKYELILPASKRKNSKPSPVDNIKKQELDHLVICCIIRDGRTFNDFEKFGIKKLFQQLVPGKFTFS